MSALTRNVWVSYLRVSTPEQAAKDLSLPAQREAVEEYARRNGQAIAREYLESDCSGTDINRKAFRLLLEDVLKPGSDIGCPSPKCCTERWVDGRPHGGHVGVGRIRNRRGRRCGRATERDSRSGPEGALRT